MAILTKSSILKGIKDVQQVTIESLGGELWLRPLSSAELDEISLIEAEGLGNVEQNIKGQRASNTSQTTKLNVLRITKAQDEAKYQTIFKSLDNPKNESDPWTLEEIQALPINATDELYKKVRELSGVDVTKRDVKQFLSDE